MLPNGVGEGVQATAGVPSVVEACRDELKRYIASPLLDLRTKIGEDEYIMNDPLEWWRKNQVAFPILARLARIYLAVQATSAPSERVFSLASRVISSRRGSMDPDFAGKMLFVTDNWEWWQRMIDFHKATSEQVQEESENEQSEQETNQS